MLKYWFKDNRRYVYMLSYNSIWSSPPFHKNIVINSLDEADLVIL